MIEQEDDSEADLELNDGLDKASVEMNPLVNQLIGKVSGAIFVLQARGNQSPIIIGRATLKPRPIPSSLAKNWSNSIAMGPIQFS